VLIAKDGIIRYARSGYAMQKIYFDTLTMDDKIEFTEQADTAKHISLTPFKVINK
jgi:hypothetical protein